jgi:hypothetical protein
MYLPDRSGAASSVLGPGESNNDLTIESGPSDQQDV